MTVHKLISRRSKRTSRVRRSPDTTTESHVPVPHIQTSSPVQEVGNKANPLTSETILQLQGLIGNHATLQRLSPTHAARKSTSILPDMLQRTLEAPAVLSHPLTVHSTSPHIQRTPLSDKEAELVEAENARLSTKTGTKARTRINQKITKIKEEIESLKSESDAPAVTIHLPETPKTAAEEFPALKPTFTDEEITTLRDQVGSDTLKEVLTIFLPVDLKTNVTTLSLPKFKELVDTFTAQELNTIIGVLTTPKLKELVDTFTTLELKPIITTLTTAKLKELLTGFTTQQLKTMVTTLTTAKVKDLADTFTPVIIKTMITQLTIEKMKELVDNFTMLELSAMINAFSPATLKDLITKFPIIDLKHAVTILTVPTLKLLLVSFTSDEIKTFATEITVEKLKQLVTAWPVANFKVMFVSLGMPILKDMMSQFTGAELKTFITTVGTVRFDLLVKTHKIKATGLKKYTAAWLKTFVGANATTMSHLLTIYTKSDGVISGGHDAAVFYPEIDRIIGTATFEDDNGDEYDEDISNGRVTYTQVKTNYDKVSYTTHNPDGSNRNSGSKTLVHNLSTQQATWLKRANEAIWKAIAAETFTTGAWSGTSADGIVINGFYNKPNLQVDTFFPVT